MYSENEKAMIISEYDIQTKLKQFRKFNKMK